MIRDVGQECDVRFRWLGTSARVGLLCWFPTATAFEPGARTPALQQTRVPPTPAYCYNNAVGNINFAWDRSKARSNLAKHGVSFEEAQTAFLDESARLIDDPDHSEEEDRFLLLGFSFQARCLIVSHCYRQSASVIRLISARRATVQEEETYWEFR